MQAILTGHISRKHINRRWSEAQARLPTRRTISNGTAAIRLAGARTATSIRLDLLGENTPSDVQHAQRNAVQTSSEMDTLTNNVDLVL